MEMAEALKTNVYRQASEIEIKCLGLRFRVSVKGFFFLILCGRPFFGFVSLVFINALFSWVLGFALVFFLVINLSF